MSENEVPAQFEDDDDHPIPSLRVVDVIAAKVHGGADLVIVIASPLEADARSQHRLLGKIEAYLGYIVSDDFRVEFGQPTPENTAIVVKLHPESAPEIADLLAHSKEWVRSYQASLVVEPLESKHLQS